MKHVRMVVQIAELLIQKSTKFNIDLNAKDEDGMTAFHSACFWGEKAVVEVLMKNSEIYKIDLISTNRDGRTGFQCAKLRKKNSVVNVIEKTMPKIAFDFLPDLQVMLNS